MSHEIRIAHSFPIMITENETLGHRTVFLTSKMIANFSINKHYKMIGSFRLLPVNRNLTPMLVDDYQPSKEKYTNVP